MAKRIWQMFFSLCLVFLNMSAVQAEETGTIYIDYHVEGLALPQADFGIYQLYTMDDDGDFSPTKKFQKLGDVLDLEDNEAWLIQSKTAYNFINAYGISPDERDSTDDMGRAVVTDLEQGIYLLKFDKKVMDGMAYETDPILVVVPGAFDEDEEWTQSLVPKVESYEEVEVEYITVIVLKTWRNDTGLDVRPDTITFHLHQDGEIVDTVELGEQDAWAYRWDDLDASSVWAVTEGNIPDGYTCLLVDFQEDRYTKIYSFQNTYTPESQLGGGDSVGVGGGSVSAGDYYDTDVEGALTETGALMWPIPVLLSLGAGCFAFALILRKEKNEEKEL